MPRGVWKNKSRDEMTALIRSMYEVFPFPNLEYQRVQGMQLAVYFARNASPGSKSLLSEGLDVLDAGCGTGSTVIPLAKSYPQSRFTGFDMTSKSLEIARGNAEKQGLSNMQFVQGDIQTIELGKQFDVVLTFGCLSILADREEGLRRLSRHVKDNGRIIIWVYGSHGRHRLQLNQSMLQLLVEGTTDWNERRDLSKRAIATLPRKLTECYFSVPTNALEGKFDEGLDWILGNDSWFADQFLHPVEVSFDMTELLDVFEKVGLRFESWIGTDLNIAKYTQDEVVQQRVKAMPERDRLIFFDLLLKPVDYFLVARPIR
jgi:ubiquinone/menaquinone biosynthesis C-methylase UbiE